MFVYLSYMYLVAKGIKKNRHITQRNKEQRVKCSAEKREVEIKWMEEEVTEGEEEGTIHKQCADAQPKKLILNL